MGMERSVALNLIKIIEFNSSRKSTIYPVQACTPAATYISYNSSCSVCLSAMCERRHQNNILHLRTRSQASSTQNRRELQCEACTRSWSSYLVSRTAKGVKNDSTTFFVIYTSGTQPVHSVATYQHIRCTRICHSSPNLAGQSGTSYKPYITPEGLSIRLWLAHVYKSILLVKIP